MPQSETRAQRVDRVFNAVGPDSMALVDEFYAPDVVFADPVGRVEGREKLKAYYKEMYKNVQEIRFDFEEHISEGKLHVGTWTMHLRAKGLNGGETVTVEGNSVLKFNAKDQVDYHRDYFDMGEFIYEHIPVLGFLVRRVRGYFKHD